MQNNSKSTVLFDKRNYRIMIIGTLVMLLGYILMAGGGSDDPQVWNDAIFSIQRIRIAPILILVGIGINCYGILTSPSK